MSEFEIMCLIVGFSFGFASGGYSVFFIHRKAIASFAENVEGSRSAWGVGAPVMTRTREKHKPLVHDDDYAVKLEDREREN